MAQNEHESLCALEPLMDEFFSAATTNGRKHEIEVQLGAFSSQRDSWKACIYFLNHTSSQYVSMYALSTIESVINRQWFSLDWEHRKELKTSLHTFLLKNNAGCPNFLRNKLAKLLVDIARHDWPHFYPEYITIVFQFLQSEQEQLLGLVLLRTTSEEIMSNRVEMSSHQKEKLQHLLEGNIPQLFQQLTELLEHLGARRRKHTVTATPPPSPTHPTSDHPSPPPLTEATFRPDSREVTREVLATLQHIFSWVDLTHITSQLISAIFYFTNTLSSSSTVTGEQEHEDDMCVLAMSTINELLYRKCAPPGSQNLFIELYHYAVHLLRDVTTGAAASGAGGADHLSADFVDKLTEFLCLLVSQHLWRLEVDGGFSALDFLSLLYQCTFQQTNIDSFLSCLDVWRAFMKQLKRDNSFKYSEALLSLVKQVLNKMQFMHNQNQLEDLDNELIDDDNETEWQHFLKECIEMIAMVAELLPQDIFQLVWQPWHSANDLFHLIEKAVNLQTRQLTLEPIETQRLHCILRDLSSLTQTLARLSIFFTEPATTGTGTGTPSPTTTTTNSDNSNACVDSLVMDLLKTALYATRIRFDRLHVCDRKLGGDFVEVHAQILAGLKTWCFWFVLNKHNPTTTHLFNDITTVCTSILLNGNQENAKLSLSAAHLLLCLTNITFPPNLITLPPIAELLRRAPHLSYQDEHSLNILLQAMCNLLIRPWGDLNENDKTQRQLLIKIYFDGLTRNFRELTTNTNQANVRAATLQTLPKLCRIIEYCKNHSTVSKKLLFFGIQGTVQHALILFPTFACNPEINSSILELFLGVLEVLQQQLGLDFTKMAVQVFLDVAISEQRAQRMSGLDKLLQILQLVVEGPAQIYKTFLPGIINLCMDHVYPLVACQPNQHPDIISALLALLHSIMLHRWQYFYTSQVRLGYSPGASDTPGPGGEALHNQEQLLSILQAFGQALLQPDINVFRLSLASLEHLNNKWKLYHKSLFKERLLSQFLTVLLQTLLHKSHALLNDDIMLAIYNMCAVDFDAFFSVFLVQFIQGMDGLDSGQRETLQTNFLTDMDMPTFIQNVHRFINDMRCYRICNSTLPSGSIVL